MEIICHLATVGTRPVLQVSGEIDLATLPVMRDQLMRAVGQHAGATVWVDLDGVSALDDTGLGMLLGAAGRARELGGDLVVVCSSDRLLQRFGITGFGRAVDVVPNLHD
jgi:anti-sigma B factor antagonist